MAFPEFVKTLIVLTISLRLLSSVKASNAFSVDVTRRGKRLVGPSGLRSLLVKHGRFVSTELHAAANDPSILIDGYRNACAPAELADLQNDSGKNYSGSTAVQAIGDDGYFTAALTVGKSKMELVIDSGSSDLWVYSNKLPKNETAGHKLYDTRTGRLVKGYTFNIEYGDLTRAAGILYRDTVYAGAASATFQAIEAATSVSNPSPAGRYGDGLLGLGFEVLNAVKPKKQAPMWQNLADTKKLFALDFRHRSKGSIDFGYIDSSKLKGPITYVPVKPVNFWRFAWSDFVFNGTTFPTKPYKNYPANGFLDSGTSFLYIAGPAATTYYKNIHGAKKVYDNWLFPCKSKVPNFGLKIGGRDFYVFKDYVGQPIGHDSGLCYGAIQGYYTQYPKYDAGDIIGDPLLVGCYVIFDGENKRLGFAHKHLIF